MSTTSSRNFTTLYSGSGSVVPQGAYGNANVVSLLSVGTDGGNTVSNIVATGNISTTSQISAQGNITTAGYFVGSLVGNVSGNVTAAGSNTQVQFNNNGVLGADADFTYNNGTNALAVTGNITGGNVAGTTVTATTVLATAITATGNVAGGNITTAGQVSVTGNITGGNILTPGTITATGNITAPYFIGNIVGNIDAGGSNTQVQFNDGDLLSGSAGFTFDKTTNAAVVAGNITAGNVNTGGVVSATGNISAGNINSTNYVAFGTTGAQTTAATGQMFWDTTEQTVSLGMNNGVTQQIGLESYILVKASATITNGQVVMFTGANGDNVQAAPADTTSVGFRPEYIIGVATQDIANNAFGYITTFGKVRGLNTNAYTVGDILWVSNSTPGALTATQPTDPNYQIEVAAVTKKSGGDGQIQVRVTPFNGLDSLTDVTITTPSTGQSLVYSGNVWVNANISAANITAAGSNTQLQFNDSGVMGASANLTFNNTTNLLSTTGNINGANLVASANLTSTQQTVIGTANVGTTGNIVVSGRNIATDMKWNPDGATGTAQYTGRVMVGTGWLGNNAVGLSSRLASMDTIDRGNTSTAIRQIEAETQINLTANVTNTGMRQQALGGRLRIGGGSAANTTALGQAFGAPFSVAAGQFNVDIGNASPYNLGNTSISHTALNGGVLTLNAGSSIGNAYGYLPSGVSGGGQANITNYIGVASSLTSGLNITGNLFCFYNGNASTLGTHGVLTANTARAATNYYFLRNDDEVAQVKLGSLRSYNEFQYATATSGTVNIDKTNAQVQFIAPTGNITIGDYQNFVSTANDGTNNDTQTDTVTLIIQQGATPYTVTMPTGNAAIKYASNVTTVGSTANSVTMVSISAFRSAANATIYLTTVSPEFV